MEGWIPVNMTATILVLVAGCAGPAEPAAEAATPPASGTSPEPAATAAESKIIRADKFDGRLTYAWCSLVCAYRPDDPATFRVAFPADYDEAVIEMT